MTYEGIPGMRRPSHATVVAYLALFVALATGGAWAAGKIQSGDIAKDAVQSKQIAEDAVRSNELKAGSVKAENLLDGAVGAAQVAGGSLGGAEIANGSLDGADVANGGLTGADVENNSLKGADIDEASLAGVNAAELGGAPAAGHLEGALRGSSMQAGDADRAFLSLPGETELRLGCDSTGSPTASIQVRNLGPFQQSVFFDREGPAEPASEGVNPGEDSTFGTNVTGNGPVERFTFLAGVSTVYEVFVQNDLANRCNFWVWQTYNSKD